MPVSLVIWIQQVTLRRCFLGLPQVLTVEHFALGTRDAVASRWQCAERSAAAS